MCMNLTTWSLGYDAARGINLYIPPILIITGSVCNILVVMVMRSDYFCFVSTSFYMTVNAIVDTLSLLFALSTHWVYLNFPDLIFRGLNSDITCKFFQFFGWGTSDYGVILTAAMTTEKAIAIMFPLKASSWCTTKRAKRIMVMLAFVIVLKESHFLFKAVMVPVEGICEQLCDVDTSDNAYAVFWHYIWPWVHNLFLLFSFVTIGIGNAIILRHVKRSEYLQKSFTVSFGRDHSGKSLGSTGSRLSHFAPSRSRQLSILLLIDSFTVIICTVPFSLFMTLANNFQMFDNTTKQQGIRNLLFTISFNLLYLNRCANFYLYCISGSRFRQALKSVCCKKPEEIIPNSSSNNSIMSPKRRSSERCSNECDNIEICTHAFLESRSNNA